MSGDSLQSRMFPVYIKNVNAVFLVYDVTNKATLKYLDDWHSRAIGLLARPDGTIATQIVVLGNKFDQSKFRQVSTEEQKKAVERLGHTGYFCSAKTNDRVDSGFRHTACRLLGIDYSQQEDKV